MSAVFSAHGFKDVYKRQGKNMAWLLKCIALGRENGLPHPDNEKVLTNFIR